MVRAHNLSPNAKGFQAFIPVENLAAGADIAARAVFCAPQGGAVLRKWGILPQGSKTGIDDSNTAVLALADGAGNAISSKTYNTANQPPAANVYADLGTLSDTHKVLTANEVVTLAVTQGAAADLPAFVVVIEWEPADGG